MDNLLPKLVSDTLTGLYRGAFSPQMATEETAFHSLPSHKHGGTDGRMEVMANGPQNLYQLGGRPPTGSPQPGGVPEATREDFAGRPLPELPDGKRQTSFKDGSPSRVHSEEMVRCGGDNLRSVNLDDIKGAGEGKAILPGGDLFTDDEEGTTDDGEYMEVDGGGDARGKDGAEEQNIDQVARNLEKAISQGDLERGTAMLKSLIKWHPEVRVHVLSAHQQPVGPDPPFLIHVTVDTAGITTGPTWKLQVKQSMTFFAIKMKVALLYGIPTSQQSWIVGKAIPMDTDTFRDHNVRTGAKVFLYVNKQSQEDAEAERLALDRFRREIVMKGDNKEMELHFTPDEYQKSLREIKLQQSKRSIRHNEQPPHHQNPPGRGQDVSQHQDPNSIPAGPDTHLYLPFQGPVSSQLPLGPVYEPPGTFPGTYGTVGQGPQQPDRRYAGQEYPGPQYYRQGEMQQWQPPFNPPNGPTNYPPNGTRVFPPPPHLVQDHIPQSDHARSYHQGDLTENGRRPLGPANPSRKMRTMPLRPMDFNEGNLHHPEMEPDLVIKGHHHAKGDISRLFMPVEPQKETKRVGKKERPKVPRLRSSYIDGPPYSSEGAPVEYGFSLGKKEEPTQHFRRHLEESPRRRQRELYARGPPPRSKKPSATEVGWKCRACTFVNPPSYPGCKQCLQDRPKEYEVPSPRTYIMDEEEKNMVAKREASEAHFAEMQVSEKENERETANLHRTELLRATEVNVTLNEEQFECPVCFAPVPPGRGVRLQECLHEICRDCCIDHINISEEAEVKCPFTDGDNDCQQTILDREIRQIVGAANYDAFAKRSLKKAEATSANTFHCLTPNCEGWCFFDDDHNFFACPICHRNNCLTCNVFHEGMNCREYQDDIRLRAANDMNAKETQRQLEQLIVARQAQRCPGCGVVIQKKGGCTHMTCSVCHKSFTWTGIEM